MKRPISVTIVAIIMIAAGVLGFASHLSELDPRHLLQNDALWVQLIRLLAVVAGLFLLRRKNWARWLTIAWIAFHVAISAFDSLPKLAAHAAFLAVFAVILFRRPANEYFASGATG
jgi:hypothetical protein